MKNTCSGLKLIVLIVIAGISVFFMSCGLDSIITVNPPVKKNHNPLYNDANYLTWYFDFDTEEDQDLQNGKFVGTEIYYRIYNNFNNLSNDVSSIINVNTASNSTASFSRLESLNYQTLRCGVFYNDKFYDRTDDVFVPESGNNKHVRIRLKTYTSSDAIMNHASVAIPYSYDSTYNSNVFNYFGYQPGAGFVNYKYVNATDKWYNQNGTEVEWQDIILVEPFRNVNGKIRSFDFFDDMDTRNSTINTKPEADDPDFNYSSSGSEEDSYYVQLFAVSVAWDPINLSYQHSLVLDLGSIPIKKGQ